MRRRDRAGFVSPFFPVPPRFAARLRSGRTVPLTTRNASCGKVRKWFGRRTVCCGTDKFVARNTKPHDQEGRRVYGARWAAMRSKLSSGAFHSPTQNACTPRDASRQGVTSSHSTHQTAAVGIRQLAWDVPFTNHTAGLISSVSLARPRALSHACPRDATLTCGSRQAMCDP